VSSQFLTVEDVCQLIGVGRPTIDRMVKSGALPPPLRLSRNTKLFRRADVEKALGVTV
jgi:excisionase family DNA binding protein